jgi:hypothetical protein
MWCVRYCLFDCGLLGCDGLWTCWWVPTFWGNILPPSSGLLVLPSNWLHPSPSSVSYLWPTHLRLAGQQSWDWNSNSLLPPPLLWCYSVSGHSRGVLLRVLPVLPVGTHKLSRRGKVTCNIISSQNQTQKHLLLFKVSALFCIVYCWFLLLVSCVIILCHSCLHSCAWLTSIMTIFKRRRLHVRALKLNSRRPVLIVEETCLQFSEFMIWNAAKRWTFPTLLMSFLRSVYTKGRAAPLSWKVLRYETLNEVSEYVFLNEENVAAWRPGEC